METKPAVRTQCSSRGQHTNTTNWTFNIQLPAVNASGLKRPQRSRDRATQPMFTFCHSPPELRAQLPYTQQHRVYNHVTFDSSSRRLPARTGSCIPQGLPKFGSGRVPLRRPLYHRTAVGRKQKQSDSVVPIAALASMETWSLRWPDLCAPNALFQSGRTQKLKV